MSDRVQGFNEQKNTKRPFKFFLSNPSEGPIELYNAPDGWEDAGYSFKRSERYLSIFRKYALSKLGFVKEGKAFLEKIEAEQGFEAEVTLIVWAWDPNKLTYYEDFRGDIQLVDKDVDELKYTAPVADSSFENKVINREDAEVIVTKTSQNEVYKSLDGKVIEGFANEISLVTLPPRIDFLSSTLTADRGLTYFTNPAKEPIIPLLLVGDSEDPNIKGNTNDFKQVSGAFYVNATGSEATVELQGSVDISVDINPTVTSVDNIKVVLYVIDNTDIITKEIEIPTTKTLTLKLALTDQYSVVGDIDITDIIPDNSYVQIGVMEQGFVGVMFLTGSIIDFSARTQGTFTPLVNIEGVQPHEGVSRVAQVTTSENVPVYSEILGRKNSEPRAYTYDGELSGLFLTNGGLIRGFGMTNEATFNDVISPLSLSLKDLFGSINTIRPIGMGIETIDGSKTIRIEGFEYFFDTRVSLYIDNATEVKRDYNKDLILNSVQVGYKKFESDEKQDGVFDYNTKSTWNNAIISVKNEDKFLSEYSASNTSINEARKITKEDNPTTDSKYDEINYMIDVVDNSASNSVSNPNADNGTTDWSITTGVTTEILIGNPRFVLDFISDTELVEMSQQLVPIETPVVSFSYAMISSKELIFTPTFRLIAVLNDTSVKYLNTNGEWVDDAVNISLPSTQGVQDFEFQSMFKFYIAAKGALQDINYLTIEFSSAFIGQSLGINQYIIDDIYVSDSAKLKARTTEGFDYITGIVNSNDSYNIDLSPARCFERRGAFSRAPLEDKLNTNYVFSKADKFSTLVSKKTSEEKEVAESSNFLVNDLRTPLWGVERLNFDASLSAQQKIDLNGRFDDGKPKALALVAWRENTNQAYEYGWINDGNSGGFSDIAKFELIPISKYITVAEETVAVDDDLEIFTDDDNENFIIE